MSKSKLTLPEARDQVEQVQALLSLWMEKEGIDDSSYLLLGAMQRLLNGVPDVIQTASDDIERYNFPENDELPDSSSVKGRKRKNA
ncbi:hypothetical protein BVH22_001989 [Salmonella enterica subsp. enterica serovar Ughelli]|nr:hypothetical protein [Salmonella enterica subsp. enterica serovar Ughelli]